MRHLKLGVLILALAVVPLQAADQPSTLDQVVDRFVAREAALYDSLKQYEPLVETYIQSLKPDKELGPVPNGDNYFLGRAQLGDKLELISLGESRGSGGSKGHFLSGLFGFGMEFLPKGFLQMVYIDQNGFDRQHYNFDFVRREFLGEVRCLVFDVTPLPKSGRGRFLGRIWVEDQDYNIVRFNGAYSGSTKTNYYFHFDSWRVNTAPAVWLPAFVYSEESNYEYGMNRKAQFKAQTRLWGYNLTGAGREQELARILVESNEQIKDQSNNPRDLSPIESQRYWDRQAEENVVDRLERIGMIAPRGEVDKVLETVINNLEVTNNLDIQPEIRCRVLLTSTLESFTVGHTIVLSRGLIDTLPDEASLATMLAHELGHVVLGHRVDSQFAFFDRLLFNDKETFRHFFFARTKEEEDAASQKAVDLLAKSPYKDQLAASARFALALENRSKQVPNLISPHLGNRVPFSSTQMASAAPPADAPATAADSKQVLAALPLGGRVKVNPWNDRIEMMKTKPVGMVAEREKMPFEVTPFMLYLTRLSVPGQAERPVSAQQSKPPDSQPKQQ